uniref:CD109 molecule n=1 Tax=Scleropages formosus TaxID=113540 RepID=A0A8C9QYB7_SCLFO
PLPLWPYALCYRVGSGSPANASHPFMLEVKGYVKEREVLNNRTVLEFRPRRSATFIQTDKSNYKPGQVVKIRVVSIYPDDHGSCFHRDTSLFFLSMYQDPKGHMIQRWLSLESFLGVVSKEFQLSENPPLGMWTIEASTIVMMVVQNKYNLMFYGYSHQLNVFPQVKSRGQVVAAGKETSASFSLNPEDDWTPLASIIVYTIHTTGEVVSDVLQAVVMSRSSQVSLSWSQARAKPAEKVELKVSVSEPGSLVGVLVVDKAAQLAKPNNGIDMDEVSSLGWPKLTSLISTCHAVGLGNELATMMREDKQEQEPQVRRDFPETWLWLDANMSESTTKHLSLTAPDSITSWIATAFVMSDNLGLGLIETPSKLTVFQNFFISLNLPAYIIRGEQLVLEVNLFNYLDRKLEVTVIVVQNSSFEFVLEKQVFGSNMRTVFVERQDSASVLFPIRPKVLGEISISVKAVSNIASDAIIRKVLVKLAPSSNALYQEIMFTFPEDVVEGSERAHVTVVGDVLGQSIKGLESLIQVPYGCGEQNMINFAPNVYVLQYLTRSGYQQELTYQRMDGSFSAFGNLDSSGSTWLSAFVLRCFLQSRPFITVEQTVLTSTANWLVQQQNHDGSFKEPGTVIHTELQGGLDGPVSLTAYVLMALLEDPAYTVRNKNNVTLETCTNYSLSLVAYALSLANSSKAKTALSELVRRADVQDGVMSWRTPGVGLVHHWQARSTDIETAAYVLLAMFTQGMVVEGLSLMKWLCRQQNHLGGYGSTQDTIIALQALSCYAALSGADAIDLRITVNTTASRNETGFQVDSNNYLLLQSQKVTLFFSLNMRVGVLMVGRGFVLFQVMKNNYFLKMCSPAGLQQLMHTVSLNALTFIRT